MNIYVATRKLYILIFLHVTVIFFPFLEKNEFTCGCRVSIYSNVFMSKLFFLSFLEKNK